ncbi:NADH dehydrogenase [ubiquinone] 1 alpha subcomplex subunit 3-like [Acomys russatus]|uniref:NADH dehydrogenase [ubiquinone] 1 alpha subcomplex subunit 3-like n=1 Tax=Acomys russatus TaxID=60746 RepID=UPI0021E2CA7A|nr:NADH dehydrogenase [ubiquinone] 1 alpha subcomplex subunit 3-like [Acomys russatus]
MARRISAFLKNVWAKELVLSFCVWGLPVIVSMVRPYTKYAEMINQVTPYHYPVPVGDDGNLPDVPSHPQDPSLEWLKNP